MTKKNALSRCLYFFVYLLFFSLQSFSQNNFKVTGKVTDNSGNPVQGATVTLKGSNVSAITSVDGNFTINVPDGNAVIIITSIGYAEQSFSIKNRSAVAITLQTAASSLQDIVVIGYGTQRKSDVTGALSRITADVIQERPAQNVLQAIQGKASGVQVSSNMKPGELPIVRVRGNRSLGASNDPLYVIDGIPTTRPEVFQNMI